MIVAIVLAIVAFLVVATLLARQTSSNKKRAIADLDAERKSVGRFDIFELVESETTTLGLLDIDGAQDIPHGVLLKIWTSNQHVVESCTGKQHLRYVVAHGVTPANATETDVTLECTMSKPIGEPGAG